MLFHIEKSNYPDISIIRYNSMGTLYKVRIIEVALYIYVLSCQVYRRIQNVWIFEPQVVHTIVLRLYTLSVVLYHFEEPI